ncbi:MAG: nucleotidyltransferase [Candidatus Cloacimonetes bacterium HGW-Cloacimonetes-3]|jgi:nucleotidyltransferase substrate binding protein (TIGR01987 family)|nr:MAG: nucleotidyltransferase [Candidatus Cloacimonetes bacterium HGW-Cloacimonetes-3]
MEADIRWQQRFENYKKALNQLDSALQITSPSIVERAGIIQMFEFTAELAWNTLKDLLEYQGENNIVGSREAINLAFKAGIITDGVAWINMLKSRNLSSHIYNEPIADEILADIVNTYHQLFKQLQTTLTAKL